MLTARSIEEALLYLDLHCCSCTDTRDRLDHRLEKRDGVYIEVYEGRCQQCGETGRYEFVIDPSEAAIPPAIGGTASSRIIDPGEFLWFSDNAASRVPVDISMLSDVEVNAAGVLMENAIAALEEVRKFIPEGDSVVPRSAFVSKLGSSVRRNSPERFHRKEIDERLELYRQSLAQLRV